MSKPIGRIQLVPFNDGSFTFDSVRNNDFCHLRLEQKHHVRVGDFSSIGRMVPRTCLYTVRKSEVNDFIDNAEVIFTGNICFIEFTENEIPADILQQMEVFLDEDYDKEDLVRRFRKPVLSDEECTIFFTKNSQRILRFEWWDEQGTYECTRLEHDNVEEMRDWFKSLREADDAVDNDESGVIDEEQQKVDELKALKTKKRNLKSQITKAENAGNTEKVAKLKGMLAELEESPELASQ